MTAHFILAFIGFTIIGAIIMTIIEAYTLEKKARQERKHFKPFE